MPKLKNTLLSTIPARDISKWAKWTEEHFWENQKGNAALYDSLLRFPGRDFRSDDFLQGVYDMLAAFKMNSRRARLSKPATFKKSIKKHADTLKSLTKVKLEKVKGADSGLIDTINCLFDNLKLVQTQSRLVTFSKAMHFLLPDLFMPIDHRYTLRFFYGQHAPANQKACFLQVFEQFRQFAHAHGEALKALVDKGSRWNRNIPKIIDNVIIGFVSNKMD
jgi:hypothetical protein